jgi:hypothetical protein
MNKSEKSIDIQELIEQFDFNELSAEEQAKVLDQMSVEAYTENRKVVLASIDLFAIADMHLPKDLKLPEKQVVLMRTVPLYQVFIAMAAIFLFMLLIFPLRKVDALENTTEYVTLYDTVEIEVVKYDTIVKRIEVPVYEEKIIYKEVLQSQKVVNEEPKLLDVPLTNQDISFSQKTLDNRGVSMKYDTLVLPLPKVF